MLHFLNVSSLLLLLQAAIILEIGRYVLRGLNMACVLDAEQKLDFYLQGPLEEWKKRSLESQRTARWQRRESPYEFSYKIRRHF